LVSRLKLLFGLLLLCSSALAAQPDPFPQVATSYLVEINGGVVWEKHPGLRLPPASLTKLMVALLVVEQDRLRSVISVSPGAADETGKRIGLRAGEQFRTGQLLAAALIDSANDACRALADASGGQAQFVQRMNRRAQQLGMRNTHFSNACGHDAPDHYSSAHDLALLAHELLKHPEILVLTTLPGARIATLDGKYSYSFDSSNALIGRYRGARGLKTGYTENAGKCLVAYAERGKDKVLLVMLHGNDRWWDAADILDLAFDHARAFPS
jgi:D-alanyl-D-alanine carboxypeptidase (penicillin-binding protein 5/6)